MSKGSPANRSGLEPGDVVLSVDGQKITDGRALRLKIGAMSPGTTVMLTVFRNGATREMTAKLGDLPAATGQSDDADTNQGAALRGISATDLTPSLANQLKLPSGSKGAVVINVETASPAEEAGLERGDVIQEVNRQPVADAGGFERAIRTSGNQPVLLLINRIGMTTFVVVASQ